MNAAVSLLERCTASVVGIHANVPQNHPSVVIGLGSDRRGTGTLISSDGLVLTVNYVVMGAKSLIVTLSDSRQYDARIIAQDFLSNLALLKVEGSKLPFAPVVSSEQCVLGQDVFTVTSTGDESRRADSGIITYLGPFDALWEFILDKCIISSAMNFGFGGAPLFNSKGEVIGVAYLSMTEINKALLAIPTELFVQVRDELITYGRRVSTKPWAWFGLLSYTLREHIIVAGLLPGGPAEKGGLKQGDVILAVDGQEVNERRALYQVLRSHEPGEPVSFKVFRDNRVETLELKGIRIEEYFG